MAGAFDFYVDESLLEQLLGGGDSGKPKKEAKKDGTGKSLPTAAARPVSTDLAAAPAVAARSAANAQEKGGAQAPTQDSATIAWQDADRRFAAGEYAAAASGYSRAAAATQNDAAAQSTLHYNAGIAWLQGEEPENAAQALFQAETAQPVSRSVRLALAMALLRLNRQQEAISRFDAALAATPSDPDALLGKMQALNAAGDFDQATAVCQRFREHHPRNPAGFEAALALRAAMRDREGVERAAHELRQIDPNATTALKVLAAVAIARHDYDAAAGYFDVLTANAQGVDFDGLIHAAAAYQHAGRFEQAAAVAQRALDLQPGSFEAATRLAESQQKLERWTDALASYEAAIRMNPDCPDVLWNLALVQEQLGSFDAAAETLTMAVHLRTDWQEASIRLAEVHLAAKRYQQATAVLEHCLMLRKDWPEALFNLGIALHQSGQADPAQDAVLKALEFKPDEIGWLEYLEQIALERGDALVALECQEKLAESNIESPEMAYNLGVVLQNENEPELAAKCYVRALEQRPDFGLALLNLGHALRDLGRGDEAQACWSKAILLEPSLAAGYFPD